jgi:hypothetical protein
VIKTEKEKEISEINLYLCNLLLWQEVIILRTPILVLIGILYYLIIGRHVPYYFNTIDINKSY